MDKLGFLNFLIIPQDGFHLTYDLFTHNLFNLEAISSQSDFNLLQSYFNSFGFRIMYAFDEIDGNSQGKMLRLWFKPIQEFKLCNGNIIYR